MIVSVFAPMKPSAELKRGKKELLFTKRITNKKMLKHIFLTSFFTVAFIISFVSVPPTLSLTFNELFVLACCSSSFTASGLSSVSCFSHQSTATTAVRRFAFHTCLSGTKHLFG